MVAFPVEELGTEILSRILEGGAAVATQAGVVILGGHTVKDDEPKYGLAVTGTVHPGRVVTNAGARPGDLLVLTKPIGTGILTTARKRDLIGDAQLGPAIDQMVRLNDRAARAMLAHGAHGATDITGYGLVGHAGEMARASGVALAIDAQRVPLFDGVLELVARDAVPGGTRDNLTDHARFTQYAPGIGAADRIALSDAQTSGGLLIAIAADGAARVLAELDDLGSAAIVGEVLDGARRGRRPLMARGARTLAALSAAAAVLAGGSRCAPARRAQRAAAATMPRRRVWQLMLVAGQRGSFRDAVAAYAAASEALARCPASDRAGRIDAYVDAAHAVIAGATHAADSPRDAAVEARLVSRATALRAQVNLEGADPARLSAIQEADGWVEAARAIPHGPLPPRR